ncbi:MAG: IS630 family transposase [Alkaliphilus sp.]
MPIKKMTEDINEMVNFTSRQEGKKFRLMYQDEAGFGRINKPRACWCGNGVRPVVHCLRVREYMYAYGAISPMDGAMVSLVLPKTNTACINIFLAEVASRYPDDIIMMVVDNASWHKSKGLVIPKNISLYPLLPYTPELNPIEMIWDELREKFFKNNFFDTLSAVTDRLCEGLLFLETNHKIVQSITGWEWIISSFSKEE